MMNALKSRIDHDTIIAWGLVAVCLAGYIYFDIGTRWKLSGTWDCVQAENAASTVEKFGFFGSLTTLNSSGSYAGLQVFSTYSLDGLQGETVSKAIKRADGEIREFDEIQWSRLTFNIASLTDTALAYSLESHIPDKRVNVQCQRQN